MWGEKLVLDPNSGAKASVGDPRNHRPKSYSRKRESRCRIRGNPRFGCGGRALVGRKIEGQAAGWMVGECGLAGDEAGRAIV